MHKRVRFQKFVDPNASNILLPTSETLMAWPTRTSPPETPITRHPPPPAFPASQSLGEKNWMSHVNTRQPKEDRLF
ncbi:hypothetical protein CDAR_205891 [Caerostris darwini]|uniref:Uncharacterized protein n=1 Tax=Caerostris darwini TaxID=1538125 RepID=A0AAV4N678_9ARAC|nr:hypothetical protein CDAR_205891 [Caerostris darwini]